MIARPGVIDWQPLTTLTFTDGEIIQHQSQWLDTRGLRFVVLNVLVFNITANYFYIETSESIEGPWTTAGTNGRIETPAGATEIVLSSELSLSDPNRLRRYIRWRSGDNPKTIGFGIRAELKS